MKCPACGDAQLIRDTRNIPYTCQGRSTVIPRITGDFCPACGESVLDLENASRLGEAVAQFATPIQGRAT
ncbi:type II toxin-antitoxin system MqsA family antitoxin [Burkholderia sp. BKH01]|uniref:type II toxin-antitoxin system MqsA family antitoxin n=1 Tax=Burkholderia sp. BKH01 TaxID=2769262 RepID=UPI0021E0F462|nr:type II toxin-antitoxin system MqsA family antitoxin [Burkholderia sp. BKH01]MCU9956797.1 type II toxin-antitoxin system MqsA family antitoxin [Burkholderia sp. BKH01]